MRSKDQASFPRTALYLANAVREGQLRSVLFASPSGREGTTTAVISIADELRQRYGLRPIVIELSPRRSALRALYRLDASSSLEEFAVGSKDLQACIHSTGAGVALLLSSANGCRPVPSIADMLRRVLHEIEGKYDIALVDAPAILGSPDAIAAGAAVPRMLLVVESGHTRYEILQRVKREIEAANITLLGTILNKHRRFIPEWIYRWITR
jgi:Mrp family chromosome partitioning ATPase